MEPDTVVKLTKSIAFCMDFPQKTLGLSCRLQGNSCVATKILLSWQCSGKLKYWLALEVGMRDEAKSAKVVLHTELEDVE